MERKIKKVQKRYKNYIYQCHYNICIFENFESRPQTARFTRNIDWWQWNRLWGYCLSSVVVSFPSTEYEELKKWNKVDARRTKKYKQKIRRAKHVQIGVLYLYDGSTVQYLHCLKLTTMSADKSWQSKALNPLLQRHRLFEGGTVLS
jgi:hypothetical protein